MDIRQLAYLVQVADQGSFSRAAAFLHIAQPALSRQIATLETELKTRLLLRNGRGAVPTESGARLVEHARLILELFDRAYEDMENLRLQRTESITIGMPGSLSTSITTDLIRRLRADIPDAKVHVLTGRSTQLQEWLLSGRLDLAVLFDAPTSPLLEIQDLFDDRLYLFEPLPKGETQWLGPPITLLELADQPIIISSRPSRVREILESALARRGRKLLVECELDFLEPGFDLIQDGVGKSVGSERLRRRIGAHRRMMMRPIVEPELILKVQIVRRMRRINSRVLDIAFKILHELCLHSLAADRING
jgi:LysR family nitrogen assimilation transcriptional regulator